VSTVTTRFPGDPETLVIDKLSQESAGIAVDAKAVLLSVNVVVAVMSAVIIFVPV